jgi:hypothetical protein
MAIVSSVAGRVDRLEMDADADFWITRLLSQICRSPANALGHGCDAVAAARRDQRRERRTDSLGPTR